MNSWSYTCTVPYVFIVWCLILLEVWRLSSLHIKLQFLPQREHSPSPVQRTTANYVAGYNGYSLQQSYGTCVEKCRIFYCYRRWYIPLPLGFKTLMQFRETFYVSNNQLMKNKATHKGMKTLHMKLSSVRQQRRVSSPFSSWCTCFDFTDRIT